MNQTRQVLTGLIATYKAHIAAIEHTLSLIPAETAPESATSTAGAPDAPLFTPQQA